MTDQKGTASGPGPADDACRTGDDGVDAGLIRWMLGLTPAQRLQALQQNVNNIIRLRNAKREH